MNIETLLAPISDSALCGEDLSFSTEFDAIAEMRRFDDPTLDQGAWVTALKVADWRGVEAQCTALLQTRSKDLRLAMWLTESAALNRGYAGLKQGLQVCAALCERYWAQLYPQIEGADIEERVGNMAWLIARVTALAPLCPVTVSAAENFTLADWQVAKENAKSGAKDSNQAAGEDGTITLERFNRALRETAKADMLQTLEEIKACQSTLDHWQAVVDSHLGEQAPGFVGARDALSAAAHDATRLAQEMGAIAMPTEGSKNAMDETMNDTSDSPHSDKSMPTGGPIRSRQQALLQLREVASYFQKTEPHSPVAYLAAKAANWGEMALHEWLREVVKDGGTLGHLEELLGSVGKGNA
jgi:type VI secretion system protein ImpA